MMKVLYFNKSDQNMIDQIKQLNMKGKFSEAIELIENNYDLKSEENKTILNEYSKALYKSGNYEKSYKYSKKLLEIDETHFGGITYYCWSVYKYFLSDIENVNEGNYDKIRKKVFKALSIGSQKDDNKIFLNSAALKMMKLAYQKGKYDDVLKLSEYVVKDKDFTKVDRFKSVSDALRYYLLLAKTYYEIEKFTEALNYAEEALRVLDKRETLWIEYVKIKSLKNLGRLDEALNLLNLFKLKKSENYVYELIAEIFIEKGDYKTALENYLKAALLSLRNKEIHKYYKLYFKLGETLIYNGYKEQGRKHIQLAAILCTEQGWKIKEEFRSLLKEYDVTLSEEFKSNLIIDELRKYWKEEYYKSKQKHKGVIKKLTEKFGFIKSENMDYYFKVKSLKGKKASFKEGTQVEFYIEESYDASKDKISYSAVEIKIL